MTQEVINLILFGLLAVFNVFQGFDQQKRGRNKLASASFFIAGMAVGLIITKLLA